MMNTANRFDAVALLPSTDPAWNTCRCESISQVILDRICPKARLSFFIVSANHFAGPSWPAGRRVLSTSPDQHCCLVAEAIHPSSEHFALEHLVHNLLAKAREQSEVAAVAPVRRKGDKDHLEPEAEVEVEAMVPCNSVVAAAVLEAR